MLYRFKKKDVLPTASLYLKDAMKDFALTRKESEIPGTIYQAGEETVVVRYATFKDLKSIRHPFVYMVDDDLPSICDDVNLPDEYRRRISEFVEGPWGDIVVSASEVVVSNSLLADFYSGRGCKTVRLDPYWSDLKSQPKERTPGRRIRVGWLASRAHLNDLELILGEVKSVFNNIDNIDFTIFSGKHATDSLQSIYCLRNLKPLPWQKYRRWIRNNELDIVIHPLLDTPVNRARSVSKLIEIACVGGVPLISACPPWNEVLGDKSEFLVNPSDWGSRLAELIASPDKRIQLADNAHRTARQINEAAREAQIRYWSDRFKHIAPGLR
ncbi:MAG: hypothetical protein P1V20_26485 [Verrucomicrobiales bacterium]|nr:hypothetical protein [Verrucomicrobiales bacterium]